MKQSTKNLFVQKSSLFESYERVHCRPFLKWAGGKRQLLSIILPRVPSIKQGRYHEPFLGGGAVFFALHERGLLGKKKARLCDVNEELVLTYQVVRDQVEQLILALKAHKNEEEYYYNIRSIDPKSLDPVSRAARLIYLNKTCFNGLFRENRKGQFNVPFGRYAQPQFCDTDTLLSASFALQGTCVEIASFEETIFSTQPKDFVYFDPPYAPLNKTSSFVDYHAGGFQAEAHVKLSEVVSELSYRGVNVMSSNSNVPWIRKLYSHCYIEEVHATRSINSKAEKRGRILELLIHAGPYSTQFTSEQKPMISETLPTIDWKFSQIENTV